MSSVLHSTPAVGIVDVGPPQDWCGVLLGCLHFELQYALGLPAEHTRSFVSLCLTPSSCPPACLPPAGKMSQYLEGLAIGDSIEVKGPVGHVHYLGSGK